jgi:LysM repeat protein
VARRRRAVAAVVACGALACGCQGARTRAAGTVPAPRPTLATTTTTTTPPVTYAIKQGDTLGAIAHRFHSTVQAIATFNKIANPDKLTAGQVITLPPPPPPTTTTAATTTTLPPPAKLTVSPAAGSVGTVFDLEVTGALPAETVTFEIDGPGGRKFTGSPHTPTPAGKVSTVYVTTAGDSAGTYTVVATGSLDGSARATFTVSSTGSA